MIDFYKFAGENDNKQPRCVSPLL